MARPRDLTTCRNHYENSFPKLKRHAAQYLNLYNKPHIPNYSIPSRLVIILLVLFTLRKVRPGKLGEVLGYFVYVPELCSIKLLDKYTGGEVFRRFIVEDSME